MWCINLVVTKDPLFVARVVPHEMHSVVWMEPLYYSSFFSFIKGAIQIPEDCQVHQRIVQRQEAPHVLLGTFMIIDTYYLFWTYSTTKYPTCCHGAVSRQRSTNPEHPQISVAYHSMSLTWLSSLPAHRDKLALPSLGKTFLWPPHFLEYPILK